MQWTAVPRPTPPHCPRMSLAQLLPGLEILLNTGCWRMVAGGGAERGMSSFPWTRSEAYTHRGRIKDPLLLYGHSGNAQKDGVARLRQTRVASMAGKN